MFTVSFKPKPIALGLAVGFVFMLLFSELFHYVIPHGKWGEWTLRRMREKAAVEMHTEDIWRNGRSTFKEFDPFACQIKKHNEWLNSWDEVTCNAEDDKGQQWQYVLRYDDRTSFLTSWLLYLVENRPSREFKHLNPDKNNVNTDKGKP